MAFLGGLALVVAGIVNFIHVHDRAGLPTSIVLAISSCRRQLPVDRNIGQRAPQVANPKRESAPNQ